MPDVLTPARITWSGGAVLDQPAFDFLTPAIMSWSGVSVSDGPASSVTDSVTTPKLDRAPDSLPIGEVRNGRIHYTKKEQLRQQRVLEAIEAAFEGQQGQITDLATILARLEAAETKADAATDASAATSAELALASSFINPVGALTAANDGTITIAAHQRVYADAAATTVSVNGGSVGGFASGEFVTVYYADAARAGGAVTYQGTTSAVAQAGSTHIVGQVAIPAAGEVAVPGSGPTAPGWSTPPSQYDPRLLEYERLT